MKALVTGASGFIGSHLVRALLEKKYEVSCLVMEKEDLKWIEGLDIKLIYGDVTDKKSLYGATEGSEYIYHLAGVLSSKNPADYYNVNYSGTRNLVEACLESPAGLRRFIFSSSVAASGPSGKGRILTEDDKCNPVTDYGRSKMMAEEYLRSVGDRLPFTIVRLAMIYGPRNIGGFYSLFQVMKKGLNPSIGGGETNVCFVGDVANGMMLASEKETARGKTYFLGEERIYSWDEISKSIAAAVGKHPLTIRIPFFLLYLAAPVFELYAKIAGTDPVINRRRLSDMKHRFWRCDMGRMSKDLGFEIRFPLAEGIRLTARWYEEQGLL